MANLTNSDNKILFVHPMTYYISHLNKIWNRKWSFFPVLFIFSLALRKLIALDPKLRFCYQKKSEKVALMHFIFHASFILFFLFLKILRMWLDLSPLNNWILGSAFELEFTPLNVPFDNFGFKTCIYLWTLQFFQFNFPLQ